jgi:hypothetical protein
MNRFAIGMIVCVLASHAYATTPFPPKVFAHDSWAFVAAFAWPDENDKVLIIRTVRKTSLLSLEEMGIRKLDIRTTAGSRWYQNSIGCVSSLRIKGMKPESHLRVFYFRDQDGTESIIDLNTCKLIDPTTISNKEDLDRATLSNAALLLKSDEPQDRQTAAIHLGQLRASEYLQELTRLLDDEAAYTQISGEETKTVYYVKEAAEQAIRLIKSKTTANKAPEDTARKLADPQR